MTRAGLPREPGQRIELRIGDLRIAGASRIEARRLAEALPAALETAIAGGAPLGPRQTPAERVAGEIVKAVAAAREGRR